MEPSPFGWLVSWSAVEALLVVVRWSLVFLFPCCYVRPYSLPLLLLLLLKLLLLVLLHSSQKNCQHIKVCDEGSQFLKLLRAR